MPLPSDYPAQLRLLDRWHEGARERLPGIIPCRPGCSACCHGPFDISVADARLVRDTVGSLQPDTQRALVQRAEAQTARMRELDAGFKAPYDVSGFDDGRFDALVETLASDPCPALDDAGKCLIYRGRPMICRLMGLGLETAAGEVIENACPIQNEFPAYAALPPQQFDLATWEAGEAVARAGAAEILFGSDGNIGYETTVAGAMMLGHFPGT